ncbi:hypothetical protein [Clostridium kluyveri]|uniref:Phage-related protein n=2 Tax=Clostridium kluyveri TaxID=1534 RepID=A5F9K1_CLOK5|nr:hypothetical protein [Clostridium kluyveri]ABQ23660.1 hypothetical protein CKL_4061 [Clostridium kluyveri DSM 555]BAH08571.1 hypothetical protein CKR_P52 [Clostridium kluyveri NBRC 12016]
MNKLSTVLQPTGVEVSRLNYAGTADPYIVWFIYNENGEAFAENVEIETGYYIQVDIYTKGDFTSLYKQVLELMTAAGYYRTFTTETYEADTKLNHKIIRFKYVESSQN